jgi:hypothetical protein
MRLAAVNPVECYVPLHRHVDCPPFLRSDVIAGSKSLHETIQEYLGNIFINDFHG